MATTLVSTGVQFPDSSVQTVARTTSNTVTSFNGSVGAVSYTAPVTSVNGQTGAVTVSTSPSTSDVLNATAGASAGAVGTYALMRWTATSGALSAGSTTPGSSLNYSNATGANASGSGSGTWRVMGYIAGSTTAGNRVSVALRIS